MDERAPSPTARYCMEKNMLHRKSFTQIHKNPADILEKLIRFNTTNPPGNETACVNYIHDLLNDAGIQSIILAKKPERPNLIAHIDGRGKANPILLYGHVDVVGTDNQQWDIPPFDGKIIDGVVWGRGALDMKGGIAMMLAALLRAKAQNFKPAGNVLLAIVSDEEAGGDLGTKFLVEEHPELFKDIRYAIGEFGGFNVNLDNKRFYPITISEKQICWMKATIRGQGGHGSMPVRGGAMMKLSEFLRRLEKNDLPVHVTVPSKMMVEAVADALGGIKGLVFSQLSNPWMTGIILNLLGTSGKGFYPLFHNTVSPTILHGSASINVIPSEISVDLDGRLLPGYKPEDMMNELRPLVGDDVRFELIKYDAGPAKPDLGLFGVLSQILHEADPEGITVPFMLSGVTDGRFLSKLGIQTYGFLPMLLPEDFDFSATIHAANERVPVRAIEFGADAMFKVLERFGQDE